MLVQEEILRFEVAVVNAAEVAEGHGGDELLEVFTGDVFFKPPFGDFVEELAASDVLHDEVDLGLGGHDLEELDDVRVADAAEDGDLAFDVCDQTAFEDFLFVDHFDRDAFSGGCVARKVHLGEGSVAEKSSHFVFAQD